MVDLERLMHGIRNGCDVVEVASEGQGFPYFHHYLSQWHRGVVLPVVGQQDILNQLPIVFDQDGLSLRGWRLASPQLNAAHSEVHEAEKRRDKGQTEALEYLALRKENKHRERGEEHVHYHHTQEHQNEGGEVGQHFECVGTAGVAGGAREEEESEESQGFEAVGEEVEAGVGGAARRASPRPDCAGRGRCREWASSLEKVEERMAIAG